MKKCALHNLGCKVNSYETQIMQQLMEEAGYEIVPFGSEVADVYIINTCSVTNIADRKSRQMIHKARKLNPDAIVVATGCYVQAKGEEADEDIDIVIKNNEKSRLIEMLNNYYEHTKNEQSVDIFKTMEFEKMSIDKPHEHTRAYVKIQDGCNIFCTYCIIPYVRGRIRSKSKEDTIEEITNIAKQGCKEVVLTGIHLSSYGMEHKENNYFLIDIIEDISKIDGIERIRLGSLEPEIVTEEFAKRLVKCEKICPHFHLSLQSGCDATLKRMNRRYDTEKFYTGTTILRKYFDNPAITTDVIVGFPNETDEEFEITRQYLAKIKFYEMHIFKYSRRHGTVADKMEGQVLEPVKSKRSDILLEMDDILSKEYRKNYINTVQKVLLEEVITVNGREYITGFTNTYVKVAIEKINGVEFELNSIIEVKITDLFEKNMVIGVAEN